VQICLGLAQAYAGFIIDYSLLFQTQPAKNVRRAWSYAFVLLACGSMAAKLDLGY